MSSVVQPSATIRPDWPATMPPLGTGKKCVMPLTRATGINSESGLTATQDSTSGVYSPTSPASRVARTALISTRPREVAERGGRGDEARIKMLAVELHDFVRLRPDD